MPTFLFNEIIFGPVTSRRLGKSLGINLLPVDRKICNFNCLYCECGLTPGNEIKGENLPSRELVQEQLEKALSSYLKAGQRIDAITFAGNGEPTLHPEFSAIIEDTIRLRSKYFSTAKIAVLSNATLLHRESIRKALMKVEYNILKLDSVNEETIKKINCPIGNFSLHELIENLKLFRHNLTIQTLFFRGYYQGYDFDNSSDEEVDAWLEVIKSLQPKLVMIYTIARDTPIDSLSKIELKKLKEIAEKVEQLGLAVSISS